MFTVAGKVDLRPTFAVPDYLFRITDTSDK